MRSKCGLQCTRSGVGPMHAVRLRTRPPYLGERPAPCDRPGRSSAAAPNPRTTGAGSTNQEPASPRPRLSTKTGRCWRAFFDCERTRQWFFDAPEKGCQMRSESGGVCLASGGDAGTGAQRTPELEMWSTEVEPTNTDGLIYSTRFFMGES